MRRSVVITLLLALGFAALGSAWPAKASAPLAASAPQAGTFATPTPRPDGKIIYVVKSGDTLWVIAARAGITVEQLRALNPTLQGDIVQPGMELLLGLAGPAQPTAAPAGQPTPTPASPTPTPAFNTGELCALLFIDQNGNARLDAGEQPLKGGRVSVADASGKVAGETTTDDNPDGYCFKDLPSGAYNISAAVPPDYNPTTAMSVPVTLAAGDTKSVEFAAQPNAALAGASAGEGTRSLLLGLLGIVLLGAAGWLAYYASRLGRHSPRSLR